jgi:hypothetical protein
MSGVVSMLRVGGYGSVNVIRLLAVVNRGHFRQMENWSDVRPRISTISDEARERKWDSESETLRGSVPIVIDTSQSQRKTRR